MIDPKESTVFTTFRSSELGEDDLLKSYISSVRSKYKLEQSPILCNKCKSNSWNNIYLKTRHMYTAICSECGKKQQLYVKIGEWLYEEKIYKPF